MRNNLFSTESSRAHRTTILINALDWKFLRERGLKPTNLLRKKIHELRGDGVDFEKANEILRAKLTKITNAMEKELTDKTFIKILKESA